uniref:NADH-ubiquinone oxidoreductase chain 1 n=1 Tax=Gerrhopilus ceylonicus TaxID=3148149 RepID=A0PDM2_9SAUR|nr:NADH dehydrogenase subunit 1 [Gerrhopilus mirus]
MNNLFIHLINPIMYILPILIAVAFLTLLERKLIGYMQFRKGPNMVGPFGLLQPIADGVKLFIKEPNKPSMSTRWLFIISPILSLCLALIMWTPLPLPLHLANINMGLLFIMAVSSMSSYTILWSGWSSNSKYSLMGAIRAVAQTISYEVTLGIIILSLVMLTGGYSLQTFSLSQEHMWLLFCSWPMAMMWFISTLAETNRSPFDLTEGESELVSGFNVEYSAGPFALLFLAEYTNIISMNTILSVMFINPGSHNNQEFFTMNLMLKSTLLSILFLWIRASYPRFRYDQLMDLLWKQFLPITLALCMLHISLPISFYGTAPNN